MSESVRATIAEAGHDLIRAFQAFFAETVCCLETDSVTAERSTGVDKLECVDEVDVLAAIRGHPQGDARLPRVGWFMAEIDDVGCRRYHFGDDFLL